MQLWFGDNKATASFKPYTQAEKCSCRHECNPQHREQAETVLILSWDSEAAVQVPPRCVWCRIKPLAKRMAQELTLKTPGVPVSPVELEIPALAWGTSARLWDTALQQAPACIPEVPEHSGEQVGLFTGPHRGAALALRPVQMSWCHLREGPCWECHNFQHLPSDNVTETKCVLLPMLHRQGAGRFHLQLQLCSTAVSPVHVYVTQNHRIIKVGRDFWRSSSPTPLLKKVPYTGYAGKCPEGFWISPEKESHKFLCSSLCPLPFILLLGTSEKGLATSSWLPAIRYL